jgi:DNA-binding CsgD family transcriptional regulator
MSPWRRLFTRIRKPRSPSSHQYQLDEPLHKIIVTLAQQENRSKEEVHADLLSAGLAQRHVSKNWLDRWGLLSNREQEVTALTCLNYTNSQIAYKLGISQPTVKTHVRNILIKFQLHSKAELRTTLKEWNFREWDQKY